MLTQEILFGMNILTLAGFVVMGLTLTLHRMGQAGKALSVGLLTAETAAGRERPAECRPEPRVWSA